MTSINSPSWFAALVALVLMQAHAQAAPLSSYSFDAPMPDGSGRFVRIYPFGGFEGSISCNTNLGANDTTYAPTRLYLKMDQDNQSRYYKSEIAWNSAEFLSYFKDVRNSGFKVKINLYNYQNAASLGFGPAYGTPAAAISGSAATWLASLISFRCDLPGCFREIGDFSATYVPLPGPLPAFIEFEEPLFGYGVPDGGDGQGNLLVQAGRDYVFSSRIPSGRGNKSLMKVRYTTTTWVGTRSPYSIFQCLDNSAVQFLRFDNTTFDPNNPIFAFRGLLPQRVYAPSCHVWYYADPSGHSFNSVSSCP